MPKINDLTRLSEIICNFYHSNDNPLTIIFNGRKILLHDTENLSRKRFVCEMSMVEGECLGTGGMKHIYFADGQALFIILCPDQNKLDEIINEEITISNRLSDMNLLTQNLKRGIIQIYDPSAQTYYDYSCMFADAFTTISLERKMEVYDIKNKYRFGSKYLLFNSDDDCLKKDSTIQEKLQNLLHDLALVLYSGLIINERDSLNLVFLPSEQNSDIATVRLFLYDFSSKYYSVKLEPSFLKSLPEDERIRSILIFLMSAILYADHIARSGKRPYLQPELISTFFKEIYPRIEEKLVSEVKGIILNLIDRNKEASKISDQLIETQLGYKYFNLYQPVVQKDQSANSPRTNKLL